MLEIAPNITLEDSELQFDFVRAPGDLLERLNT